MPRTITLYLDSQPARRYYAYYQCRALWQLQLAMRNCAGDVKLFERVN